MNKHLTYFEAKRKQTELDRHWYAWDAGLQKHEKRLALLLRQLFYQQYRSFKLSPTLEPTAMRVLKLEAADKLSNKIKKFLKQSETQWVATITPVMNVTVITESRSMAIGLKFKLQPAPAMTKVWLEKYIPRLVEQLNETSLDNVKEIITEGMKSGLTERQMEEKIRDKFGTFARSRPDLISRTETGIISSKTQQDWLEENGLEKVTQIWVTARDVRVRDSHQKLEGHAVKRGQPFNNRLYYPRDITHGATGADIIQCRCTLKFKIEG